MKYLLFNWEDVDCNDPSELTNEEFEVLAKEHGVIYHTTEDFTSAFNGEQISTATHQLRIVDTSKEEKMIDIASRFLCEDDDYTIADQIKLIEAQAEIDDSVMLDHVDNVTVWEKVEYSFTVSSFLDEINN